MEMGRLFQTIVLKALQTLLSRILDEFASGRNCHCLQGPLKICCFSVVVVVFFLYSLNVYTVRLILVLNVIEANMIGYM